MVEHKRQHWIPQSYLAAWCDPDTPQTQEPYVWLFAKDGSSRKRKAPENVFVESDLYTIPSPDGGRDLRIEHGLSELESRFAAARRDVLNPRKPITPDTRLLLAAFAAAMQARTVEHRDHWGSQWTEVLQKIDEMREFMATATPEQLKVAASIEPIDDDSRLSLDYDAVKKLSEQPLQRMLAAAISAQVPLLFEMNLTIVVTDDDPGFITSDAPCVWFDPRLAGQSAMYGPGLASPTIEVCLPLSPEQFLIFSRRTTPGYRGISTRRVDEFNRQTRAHAHQTFVVCRDVTRPYWLQTGMPPKPGEDNNA